MSYKLLLLAVLFSYTPIFSSEAEAAIIASPRIYGSNSGGDGALSRSSSYFDEDNEEGYLADISESMSVDQDSISN